MNTAITISPECAQPSETGGADASPAWRGFWAFVELSLTAGPTPFTLRRASRAKSLAATAKGRAVTSGADDPGIRAGRGAKASERPTRRRWRASSATSCPCSTPPTILPASSAAMPMPPRTSCRRRSCAPIAVLTATRAATAKTSIIAIVRNCYHNWLTDRRRKAALRNRRPGVMTPKRKKQCHRTNVPSEEDMPGGGAAAPRLNRCAVRAGAQQPAAAAPRDSGAARAGRLLSYRQIADYRGATDRHRDVAAGAGADAVRRDLDSGRSDREGLTVVTRETDDMRTLGRDAARLHRR